MQLKKVSAVVCKFFFSPVRIVKQKLNNISLQTTSPSTSTSAPTNPELQAHDLSDKISYAFQLATFQGPLCNEPVQGIAVFLESVTITRPTDEETAFSARDRLGRLTGEVIKTVQASIRQGFLDWSPRILLAMYSCEIQAGSKFFFPDFSLPYLLHYLFSK